MYDITRAQRLVTDHKAAGAIDVESGATDRPASGQLGAYLPAEGGTDWLQKMAHFLMQIDILK